MNYAAATPSCQMRVHLFNASQPPTTTILRKKSGLCEECEAAKSQREPLQFVADNSASPMETKLTMFLCFKRTMGGYGLPFPKLNFPIEPTSAARKAAHKQRYVLDLYWPKRKIDVEYDSDSYHASSEGIASDAQRRNALQLMGVTVITVTRGQLYNAASFDRTARIIAASIGVRLPKTSQRFGSAKIRCFVTSY